MVEKKRFPVDSIFGRIGNERGSIAENRVKRVLEDRIEAHKIPQWLTRYEQASYEDEPRGIDGWFYTDIGKIPIQIKSSRKGQRDAEKKRPRIPVVVIEPGIQDDIIFDKCISTISAKRVEYLQKRQRG